MLRMLSEPLKKMAKDILEECACLDAQDKIVLVKDGSEYLRHVQTNIKLNKKPLDDLSDTEKRVLLAYVVYIRQNITTDQGDQPNEEDAARILHGELYNNGKKDKKEVEEELERQLSKIGIIS